MKKCRLLVVLPSLSGGGAERVATILLQNFDRSRFDLTLLLLNHAGPLIGEIPSDVNLISLHHVRIRSAVFDIVRITRKLKPDVVFSPIGYMNLMLLLLRFFFPSSSRLVIREANTPSRSMNSHRSPRLVRFLYGWLYPKADVVICQSEKIKNELVEFFKVPLQKISVVENPVDQKKISTLAAKSNPFLESDGRHFVAIGRLTEQKGFVDLLKLAVHFRDQKIFFHVLGEGTLRDMLLANSIEMGVSGQVIFHGFSENPYPFIKNAEALIMPSLWEGMPNVALEALALGTPVLAYDSAGCIQDFVKTGENGWIVQSRDVEALAKIVTQPLRQNLAREPKNYLPEDFGLPVAVKKYEKAILEVC